MLLSVKTLRAIVLAVAVSIVPAVASAEAPTEDEREQIRAMILDQIAAFRIDDGEAAFAHASPNIRQMFASPERFMAMVQGGYPAIYSAKQVNFGAILEVGEMLLQQVFITGPEGASWIAAYTVEQQDDGTWRIGGVQMVRNQGTQI